MDTLVKVSEKLSSIDTKLDFLHKDFIKLLFTMLGIIGAVVGSRFVGGSPPSFDILVGVSLLSTIFIGFRVVGSWKRVPLSRKLLMTIPVSLILVSTILRGILTDTSSTVGVDLFLIGVSALLFWGAWRVRVEDF